MIRICVTYYQLFTIEFQSNNPQIMHYTLHDITMHEMSLNIWAESFTSWNLYEHFPNIQKFYQFTWKETTCTCKCFACEHQLMSEQHRSITLEEATYIWFMIKLHSITMEAKHWRKLHMINNHVISQLCYVQTYNVYVCIVCYTSS